MGDAAGYATVGILAKYRDEFEYFIEHKRSRFDGNLEGARPCLRSSSTGSRCRPRPDETVLAGGAAQRLLHPVLLLAPVAVDRRQLPDLRRPAGRQELGRDRLQHAGDRRHARADRLRARARAPQGHAAVHHAQPSGRLRHLRQGRRMHAAGLPLRVQRRALDLDRRQGQVDQVRRAVGKRIVLDNERCILCSRCVRFTREISKSNALGIKQRGDTSLVRASEDASFDDDPYSDNVIDICPVGALLSRSFLHKSRVWYLKPTPSVCPGCARGCTVNLWHRKPEWRSERARSEAERQHRARHAAREPRRQRPVDLQQGPRPRADLRARARRPADAEGQAGRPADAIAAARQLIADAKQPVALVSSWGCNEELAAFETALRRPLHDVRQGGPPAGAGRARSRTTC